MKLVFSIPGYDRKSNGLNVFHLIARDFAKLGAEVRIIPWQNSAFKYEKPDEFKDLYSARFDLSDAIAFLPDAIPSSIANDIRGKTKRCAWWLCNVPGLLGHDHRRFEEEDFLFAYSNLVSHYLPQLYYHSDIFGMPSFEEISEKRKDADLILVYTGKGVVRQIPRAISDLITDTSKVVYISRFFPESKEALYSILMRTKFLVSFDPISNLNYEATMFGAPVFLVNNMRPDLNFHNDFNVPLHGFFTNAHDFVNVIKTGLDLKIVHDSHKKALDTNLDRVKKAYNFFEGWVQNSYDPFLSDFQAKIVPMYNKIVDNELPALKAIMDPHMGSVRNLSDEQVLYLKDCVESHKEKFIEQASFIKQILAGKSANSHFIGKKRRFLSKLKRSIVKRFCRFKP